MSNPAILARACLESSWILHLAYWWQLDADGGVDLRIGADVRRPRWNASAALKIKAHGAGHYKLVGYLESDNQGNNQRLVPLGTDRDSVALARHFASLRPLFEQLDAEVVPVLTVAAGLIPGLASTYGLPYQHPRCAMFNLDLALQDGTHPVVNSAGLVVDDGSATRPAVLAWNWGCSEGQIPISGWTDRGDRRCLSLVEWAYRDQIQMAMVPRFERAFSRLFDQDSGALRCWP
jgi:hypothetical protein